MAQNSRPSAGSVVSVGAAIAAAGLWLDNRYSIRSDIAQIRCMRANARYYQNLVNKYGDSDWSFYHVIHSTKGQNETQEAFLFEGRSWTYAEFRGEIGRLAEMFKAMGVKSRTVVGMYINNSPEFMFAWWALYKIGAIPAPVNTSITKEPFRHCLRICSAELFITSYELIDPAIASFGIEFVNRERDQNFLSYSNPDLPTLKKLLVYDYGTYQPVSITIPDFDQTAIRQVKLPTATKEMADYPRESRPKIGPGDIHQFLFTSGTTGLPKASMWPAAYGMMAVGPSRWPMMFEKRRRFYISTPMFHGGAAFAVLPATLSTSGTIILARKFSVSNFWTDIRRTRSDAMFYIGEMARFLVQAPPDPHHPNEKTSHCLELMYGLGITAPVWRAFRDRFGVRWIVEYYGSSEATGSIANSNVTNDKGVGKVAHWGPLMRSSWFGQDTFYIVKVDFDTNEVWRDPKSGLCKQCGFDEVGEGITRVRPPLQRTHDYVGAGGKEATEKKLLRDVFKKGDLFVRLGDALSMNRDGYVQFQDRLGDTFRAKGHNISTTEVESAFLHHPYIQSVNVYSIPMNKYGYEGQLGCAAITFRESNVGESAALDSLRTLENWLIEEGGLPPYGVPRFLRVMPASTGPEVDLGGRDDLAGERVSLIMKKLKTGLRAQALDLPQADKAFWIEREGKGYVELNRETLDHLRSGRAKL